VRSTRLQVVATADDCWVGASRKPRTGKRPARASQSAAAPRDGRFRQVTDVASIPAGNAYISDGYTTRASPRWTERKCSNPWGSKGSKPGEFNTPQIDRRRREGQHLRRRPRQPAHPGVRRRAPPREFTIDVRTERRRASGDRQLPDLAKIEAGGAEDAMMPGAPWRCDHARAEQVLYAPTRSRAACSSLSLDGKVLGVLGESGKQLKQFAGSTRSPAPSRTLYSRSCQLARQKLVSAPEELTGQSVRPARTPRVPFR